MSAETKTPKCESCNGTMVDPDGPWDEIDGVEIDYCRACQGSGRDLNKPPCMDCGAMTLIEAKRMCSVSGYQDSCHGCELWPE